ncbi:putative hydrolase of the HAD superfamily [Bifidobacterium bohemicum]|uniref:HAD-superfamily hydrolase, subfamily IA, variant 3 n=1 Tax=Bifidobacterium bohemicum DSM 22767 TaxID=1437606 RepID=A0A086ZFV5_9BIFI|nr:HAD family phosphatase [Bifidobacterium bohemicum]KFI45405.1 HAD-superfamily hydrolase, subfamily IA, variant 3 [Bifidobacterium bohemicum DSM 22767]SCB73653.1 putative hydrolase of the HAD superfamily [Bifidobacterium bohemicum]
MSGCPEEMDMAYNEVMASGPAYDADGKPIENVIFDFGQVLIDLDPEPVLLSGYSKELTDQFFDNDRSGYRDASDVMDEGGTGAEAIEMVREQHGEQWAEMFAYYLEHFDQCPVGQMPGMSELIDDLKGASIGIWGLSNWGFETFRFVKDFPILRQLNDAVVSGYVKMSKPSRDIYEHALRRFAIPANTAVFVDDKAANIEGANEAGIRAVRFKDAQGLRRLLVEQGINIPLD